MSIANHDSVVRALAAHAMAAPDSTALMVPGREVSYGELNRLVTGFAKYLIGQGLRRGDRVVMQGTQSLEIPVAHLGTHLAGGVFSPTERMVSAPVLEQLARDLDAQRVISRVQLDWPKHTDTDELLALAEAHADDDVELTMPSPDEPAEILYTTGTTGVSKGVLSSHRNVVAVAQNLIHGMGYHQRTMMLVPAQLSHGNAFRKITAAAYCGSALCILDGFTDMNAFFKALEDLPVNALCLPPSAIRMLLTLSRDRIGQYKDKIEFVETGTASLPETDKLRMCELLPKSRLYNSYGTSEGGSSCMYDYNNEPGLIGCIGYPAVNARFMTVDDQRREVCATKDEPGLIAYGGSMVMMGYLNAPELTAETMADGILYTNDLGYIDDAGRVFIIGRRNDVINVGGKKVAPDEVERACLTIPGIAECGCTKMPDPIGGEAVKLCVVMQSGHAFDVAAIREGLKAHLEDFKLPKRIEQRDSLPYAANGKLLRRML